MFWKLLIGLGSIGALRLLIGLVGIMVLPVVSGHCPNFCNGNGRCVAVSKCECFEGWGGGDHSISAPSYTWGGDCSIRRCPQGPAWADIAVAVDTAHQPTECSARGYCDTASGKCRCDVGFTGEACERMLCPSADGVECSGRGRCMLPSDSGHSDSGHSDQGGVAIPTCLCDKGWGGVSCAEPECPYGDDPMTIGQVDEVQLLRCDLAADGRERLTLTWRGFTTRVFGPGTSAWELRQRLEALHVVGKVSVSYSSGVTFCAGGQDEMSNNLVSVTFLTEHGEMPILRANNAKVWIAHDGESLLYKTPNGQAIAYSVEGTKEWLPCSGRGRCSIGGYCECYAGFVSSSYLKNSVKLPGDRLGEAQPLSRSSIAAPGDCGYALLPITSCPGFPLECGGNGFCSGAPDYKCTCYEGWSGGACAQRTCPSGMGWDPLSPLEECSGRGACDRRTGRCMCEPGVTGAACERTVCPGAGIGPAGREVCSGHGRCLNMGQLALEGRRPDGDPIAVSYGDDPNNERTWDSWRIYGCVCDSRWTGHDCSQRTCLVGMDETDLEAEPFLRDEVQELRCELLDDSSEPRFTLTFRGAQSQLLSARATAEEVQRALEKLETIREINVEFIGGMKACAEPPGNIIRFKFQTEHGNVPPIRVLAEDGWMDTELRFSSGLHTYLKIAPLGFSERIETAEVVRGTTREAECSGRGICNRETGICECFEGYGADRWGRESCGQRSHQGRLSWLSKGGRHLRSSRTEHYNPRLN